MTSKPKQKQVHVYAVVCPDGRLRLRPGDTVPIALTREEARNLRAITTLRLCSGRDECRCCPCSEGALEHRIVRMEVPRGR